MSLDGFYFWAFVVVMLIGVPFFLFCARPVARWLYPGSSLSYQSNWVGIGQWVGLALILVDLAIIGMLLHLIFRT